MSHTISYDFQRFNTAANALKLFAQCKGIDCSLQKPPGLVILRVQEINLGYRQIAVQYSVQIMSLMPEKKIYVLGTSRSITPQKVRFENVKLRHTFFS